MKPSIFNPKSSTLDINTPAGQLLAEMYLSAVVPDEAEPPTPEAQDALDAHLSAPSAFPMPADISLLSKTPSDFPGTFEVAVLIPNHTEYSFLWEGPVVVPKP